MVGNPLDLQFRELPLSSISQLGTMLFQNPISTMSGMQPNAVIMVSKCKVMRLVFLKELHASIEIAGDAHRFILDGTSFAKTWSIDEVT